MSRRFMRLLAGFAALAVAFGAPGGGAARAAGTPGSGSSTAAPAQAAPEQAPPPPAVLDGMRTGSKAGLAALRGYFGPQVPAEEVVRRAIGLIASVHPGGAAGGTPDAATMLQEMDRVTTAARAALNRGHVLKLDVPPGFRPARATAAFDFGAPGKPPAQGFVRVAQGNSRIAGKKLAPLESQSVTGVLADGVQGIGSIDIPVTGPGPFRIVLMTHEQGDPAHTAASFGHTIMANDAPIEVMGSHPKDWASRATLTSDTGETGGGRMEHGGAMVIEVMPVQGKIHLDLAPMGGMPTYLAGLLVESTSLPSQLRLSREAQHLVMSIEQRLDLESQIQAAAAAALEAAGAIAALQNIDPAAGPNQPQQAVVPLDLPPPVFLNTEQASPS